MGDDEGSMVGTMVDGTSVATIDGDADGTVVEVGEDVPSPDGAMVTTTEGTKEGYVVEGARVAAVGASEVAATEGCADGTKMLPKKTVGDDVGVFVVEAIVGESVAPAVGPAVGSKVGCEEGV